MAGWQVATGLARTLLRLPKTKRKSDPEAPVALYPSDLFIASYPRSGNTWLRFLLSDIILQHNGFETGTDLAIHPDSIIPDLDRGDRLDSDPRLQLPFRYIKTHRCHESWMRRAIVLYRLPADALCSYYHFHLRYREMRYVQQRGIAEFCESRMADWKVHLASFIRARQQKPGQIMFVAYEQLQSDPVGELLRVCNFAGIAGSLTECRRSVSNHRFQNHAANEQPLASTAERFFRKGQVDSARDELPRSTYELIDRDAGSLYRSCSRTKGAQRTP